MGVTYSTYEAKARFSEANSPSPHVLLKRTSSVT